MHWTLKTALAALSGAMVLVAAPPAAAQEMYLGQIISMGTTFCPRGTMEADGRQLQISKYTALFALYGTTYGGDGNRTFALPNLNDKVKKDKGVRYCVVTQGIFPARD